MLELVKGEYLDRRENILLVGPSGTRKTHLATVFGMAACSQGRKVRFFRVPPILASMIACAAVGGASVGEGVAVDGGVRVRAGAGVGVDGGVV